MTPDPFSTPWPLNGSRTLTVNVAWLGTLAISAHVAAGAAGRLDDAEALFDEAEAIHVRLGAAFMAERTRVELALMRV
jgi:hypothetical protein